MSINPAFIATACLMGAISAYLARKRGKNVYLWFAIGFLFGILGIFAIFFLSSRKEAPVMEPKPEPVLTIQGPTDKFWYYLDPNYQQQGPLSKDALTSAWKAGKLSPNTYVWHEELADWQPLQETLK